MLSIVDEYHFPCEWTFWFVNKLHTILSSKLVHKVCKIPPRLPCWWIILIFFGNQTRQGETVMFSLKLLLLKKTLRLLFMDGVQLSHGYRATMRRQFTFYHLVCSTSWYLFNQPQKNERLSWTWSYPTVLNLESLDWGSSTLTIRPSLSVWTVRAADAFSPQYTNFQSSFQTSNQNKSLLLVTNNDCLILLAPKKSSQVVWFHSTSIFQRLFFCYLLKCVAIYFQCYAFHEVSICSAYHETSNRDDYRTVQWNSLGPSFQSVLGRNKCMY